MAKVNISTAYSLWRGSADTKLAPWDKLSDEQREAITGTIRALDRLRAVSSPSEKTLDTDA